MNPRIEMNIRAKLPAKKTLYFLGEKDVPHISILTWYLSLVSGN